MNAPSFFELLEKISWEETSSSIIEKSKADVERALSRAGHGDPEDFKALISPAAGAYLEDMAALSRDLTRKRFGKTIRLYLPMYLSNVCHNVCTYCGFSLGNKVPRVVLKDEEILGEVEAIKKMGYDHILLLTGESHEVGLEYFKNALRLIRPHFSHIAMEVQPLEQNEYEELIALGLAAVYVYQETYRRETYREHHPRGKKSHFEYRLETPERLGRSGIRKMGIGALIGLEDWRTDSFMTALHLRYLEQKYWRTSYSISFPRLRPAEGVNPKSVMSDRDLLQLICAYRIYDEQVELSLSTREKPSFRDAVLSLGVTSMSAGSRTNPGGYAVRAESLEQFEVSDERTPSEVAEAIRRSGYEPVWKDWDAVLG